MSACAILNLILNIFASFSKLTKGDALQLFLLQTIDALDKQVFPPDFLVWNTITFSRNPNSGPQHAPMDAVKLCKTRQGFENIPEQAIVLTELPFVKQSERKSLHT